MNKPINIVKFLGKVNCPHCKSDKITAHASSKSIFIEVICQHCHAKGFGFDIESAFRKLID